MPNDAQAVDVAVSLSGTAGPVGTAGTAGTAGTLRVRHEGLRIAGEVVGVGRAAHIAVHNPFTGALVGTVPKATLAEVRRAFDIARRYHARLSRFERANILNQAAAAVRSRSAEIANLITAESGDRKSTRLNSSHQ